MYPNPDRLGPEMLGAKYAVKIGRDLWMPFESPDHQWVIESFAEQNLQMGDSQRGDRD